MDATMMHEPLGTATIFAHGEHIHATSRIGLFDGERVTWRSYAETAGRARRLAAALRAAGARANTRVATLSWNDFAHFEAYLAVPAIGAVLHTLNLRLHPDQLRFIMADAEDAYLIADGTLLAALLPQINSLAGLAQVIVTGDTDGLAGLNKPWKPYEAFIADHVPATTTGRNSTSVRLPRFATPPVPPAIRRACCIRTAPPCCTAMPSASAMASTSARLTRPW